METRTEYTKPVVERIALKPQEAVLACLADISTCNDGLWPISYQADVS